MMIYVWLIAVVVFCVVEASTAALVSIWFAAGSLAALIAALFGAELWLQTVLFFVVSAVVLLAVRPAAKRLLKRDGQATNADAVLLRRGYVTETINNLKATGAVKVDGKVWTARGADADEVIPAGSEVVIDRIEGVKVIVRPTDE